jgi:hypothetical protein
MPISWRLFALAVPACAIVLAVVLWANPFAAAPAEPLSSQTDASGEGAERSLPKDTKSAVPAVAPVQSGNNRAQTKEPSETVLRPGSVAGVWTQTTVRGLRLQEAPPLEPPLLKPSNLPAIPVPDTPAVPPPLPRPDANRPKEPQVADQRTTPMPVLVSRQRLWIVREGTNERVTVVETDEKGEFRAELPLGRYRLSGFYVNEAFSITPNETTWIPLHSTVHAP